MVERALDTVRREGRDHPEGGGKASGYFITYRHQASDFLCLIGGGAWRLRG